MNPLNPREDEPAAAASQAADNVRAAITFAVPQDTKPYFHSSALTGGLPKTFFETEERTVTICSMRPVAEGLSLDCVAMDLWEVKRGLDELDGTKASEDILGEIFSRFCIGK